MKQFVTVLMLLVIVTPAAADYKIEMVNGDAIVVKWYKLNTEKEMVEYQENGIVSQLSADRVINIVPIAPVLPLDDSEEAPEQDKAPPRIRVEITPGNQNHAIQQAIQEAQRRSDQRQAERMIRQMKQNKDYEERRKEYERKNTERDIKNCEQRKQNAQMNVARYTTRLENAKDRLDEVRRESYTTSTAKSHKKRVRYARNRVEELERKLSTAEERVNETCP